MSKAIGWRLRALTLALSLGGLAVAQAQPVTVTDGTGKTQTLGEWFSSLKDLPLTPRQALEQKQREEAARTQGTSGSGEYAESGLGRSEALPRRCKEMPEYRIAADVDTVYARVMRRLELATDADMQRLRRERSDVMIDPNFRHVANAGAFYRMAQGVPFEGPDGEQRKMWFDLSLSKDGSGTIAVQRYCLTPLKAGDDLGRVDAHISAKLARVGK